MKKHTQLMEHDGSFGAVFIYRTQTETIAGTAWRFIMDGNKTLVVVPYQTPHAPAKAVHCVPERIESILTGPYGLGDFGFAVHRAAQANVKEDARDWESEIHEATEAELSKWKAGQKWPALDAWERDRAKANDQLAEQWKAAGLEEEDTKGLTPEKWLAEREAIAQAVFAPLNEPERTKAVEKERAKRDAKRAQIKAKHRKRIEAEKAKRAAEIETDALAELHRGLCSLGAKKQSRAKLREIFAFIREDVCGGDRISPVIRDTDLRRILEKIEQVTGARELTERVLLAYSPDMAAHVERWTEETAEAEKIEQAEARRRILDHVRYVADFGDGLHYLIETLAVCIHDDQDEELFRLVAPTEAERERIEAEIEAERLKAMARAGRNPTDLSTQATRDEGWMYERKEPDGSCKTLPESLCMRRKKQLAETLVKEGRLRRAGRGYEFTSNAGGTLNAYLKQHPVGYRRKGDKESADLWYDIRDFQEQ